MHIIPTVITLSKTLSVELIMYDVGDNAKSFRTRPRSTQPASLTRWSGAIPVYSVALRIVNARLPAATVPRGSVG